MDFVSNLSGKTLLIHLQNTLEQIKDKKYFVSLQDRGIKEIIFVGMAFYKKFVKIKSLEY